MAGASPSGRGQIEAAASLVRPSSVVVSLNEAWMVHARQHLGLEEDQAVSFHDLTAAFRGMLGGLDEGPPPTGRLLNLLTGEAAQETGRTAAVWQEASDKPGVHRAMASLLGELRMHGAGAGDLTAWAGRASERLKDKLLYLGEVDARVRSSLEQWGRLLPSEAIRDCLGGRLKSLIGAYRHIVALMDPQDPPLAWQWLRWAAEQGAEVDVVMEGLPGRSGVFAPGPEAPRPESFPPHWTSGLFGRNQGGCRVSLEFHSAPDALSEVEWTLRACQAWLQDRGVRPEEAVLFVRRQEEYMPLIESAASRLGIEVSGSMQAPLLSCGYVRALIHCLAALGGEDVRELHRVARSSYFPASAVEQRQLWGGLEAACSCSDPWSSLEEWAKADDFGQEWLAPLLEWRRKALSTRRTLLLWRDMITELAGSSRALEATARDGASRDRDVRAMAVMQRTLSDASIVRGRLGDLSYHEFLRIGQALWREETVIHPARRSGIRVISDPSQAGPCRLLAAVGMIEGAIPRRRTENPILNDDDRRELAVITEGAALLPLSRDEALRERDQFIRLCAAPSQALIFSHPEELGQSFTTPTLFLEEAARAAGIEKQTVHHRVGDLTPEPEDCRSAEVYLAEALRAGALALDPSPDAATQEARIETRRSPSVPVSPGDLAMAHDCLFLAQAERFLRWPRSVEVNLVMEVASVPDDAGLTGRADDPQIEEALSAAYDRRLLRRTPHLSAWQVRILEAVKDRLIRSWIDEEKTVRRHWPVRLTPVAPGGESAVYRSEAPIGGRPVAFRARAIATGEAAGIRIVVAPRYEGGAPDNSAIYEDKAGAYLAPILNWALISPPTGSRILEARGADGGRVRVGLMGPSSPPELESAMAARADAGAKTIRLTRAALTEALRLSASALEKLDRGDMAPSPGPHCSRCRWGEVCRRHWDYGERLDVFDAGGQPS